MTLDNNQAWRNQIEGDSEGFKQALLRILEDLDSRLKDVEDELWNSHGYLKRTEEE